MMPVIVGVFMGVLRRLVAVFMAAVAVGYFLVFVGVLMLVFRLMLVNMMFCIVGVFMSMLRRLVAVLMAVVAMGHFLMGVLMLVLVLIRAHG